MRLDEIPIDRLEPATVHTLRIFEAEDYLAALPDESALLEERFELVDAHRLEQELVCKDGRFEVESQTLVLTEGLAFRAGLDRSTAMLLPHFGRGRRLADVVAATAADLKVEDADRERFALAALLVVRRLLAGLSCSVGLEGLVLLEVPARLDCCASSEPSAFCGR